MGFSKVRFRDLPPPITKGAQHVEAVEVATVQGRVHPHLWIVDTVAEVPSRLHARQGIEVAAVASATAATSTTHPTAFALARNSNKKEDKMHSIDFLPVENLDGSSTKSGDAIVLNFTVPNTNAKAVVVVDGGYTATGDKVVEHVTKYCGTDVVDLMICTHPDNDHLNGLISIMEQCDVRELMMHLPWNYSSRASELGNYENMRKLYDLAVKKDVKITQPFTGESRLNGAISIMGPTELRYIDLLDQAIQESVDGTAEARHSSAVMGSVLLTKAKNLLERAISALPFETLTDGDDTGPRNHMSAITLLTIDNKRHLLTGDAGMSSLEGAADYYEATIGSFGSYPLTLFQAPHHGSKRNVGPTILNRILGAPGADFGTAVGYISSARASEKHPSPKVVNAMIRRGVNVYVTEGQTICHGSWNNRPGWSPISPVPPLDEED